MPFVFQLGPAEMQEAYFEISSVIDSRLLSEQFYVFKVQAVGGFRGGGALRQLFYGLKTIQSPILASLIESLYSNHPQ